MKRMCFLVVIISAQHTGGIVRRAGHVIENRTDAVDCRQIIGVLVKNDFIFL